MADCMTFPNTVEEFMEQYKVIDTEQVYTNGTEFVPIYRMRQWFQHEPEIVRCRECTFYRSDGCFFSTAEIEEDGFCHWAERRTDDTD